MKSIVTITKENTPAMEERIAQRRKEFEIKINVIITEMRKYGTPEIDILEYVEELRANFEEELKLSPKELAEKRKRQQEEQAQQNAKNEFKEVLGIYFQSSIEHDCQNQTATEFLETEQKYAELIRMMIEMSPEELEQQYDLINQAQQVYSERHNRHIIFKECLEKEVALKLENSVLTPEQITKFRSQRIKSFLKGEFDYPDLLKENIIKSVLETPEKAQRLVDTENIPDIRTVLEEIRNSLNTQKPVIKR